MYFNQHWDKIIWVFTTAPRASEMKAPEVSNYAQSFRTITPTMYTTRNPLPWRKANFRNQATGGKSTEYAINDQTRIKDTVSLGFQPSTVLMVLRAITLG